MKSVEMISSSPIPVEQSVRVDEIRALTSCKGGVIVPVAYVPLLREDRVSNGRLRLTLDMAETVHPLMNAVNVTAYAHLVPFSAFTRFNGMDEFNRSYQGIAEAHNSTVIPFFRGTAFSRNDAFWKALGVHAPEGELVNAAVLEAYNIMVNWRRRARYTKLAQRGELSKTLAEAFWSNPNMWHIVPDFDQAMMDGEVELSWTQPKAPVSGLGFTGNPSAPAQNNMRETGGGTVNYPNGFSPATNVLIRSNGTGATAHPEVFAELANAGVRLSLANIELAKQTAAFAKMRERYAGLGDDHLVDLLMEGIRIPDEALRQPILLDRKSTIFGYTERHAMDGANLAQSVTTGQTQLDMVFRTPPVNSGGVILITVEIVPEPLFERKEDFFVRNRDAAALPNFLRDYLDPEKVDVVPNRHVDVLHGSPDGVFGYAPLNHVWKRSMTRIGGKFYRPNPDQFVENRQRFWSVETINPTLTTDFYLVRNLPHTVFADAEADPFEILTVGKVDIVGNTVFGKVLEEDTGSYDQVMGEVNTSRIVQP